MTTARHRICALTDLGARKEIYRIVDDAVSFIKKGKVPKDLYLVVYKSLERACSYCDAEVEEFNAVKSSRDSVTYKIKFVLNDGLKYEALVDLSSQDFEADITHIRPVYDF